MTPKMLHRLNRLLRRHLPMMMRFEPWSRMHSYQRLLQGLAPIKVMPNHLKLFMEHHLLRTRLLKRWIPCLQYFKGWTHMTLNFMRSKVNSPTLFYGSMLKVVQAPSFLCLLLMFKYLVYLYMFFLLIWIFIHCLSYVCKIIFMLFIFLLLTCVLSHVYISITLPLL